MAKYKHDRKGKKMRKETRFVELPALPETKRIYFTLIELIIVIAILAILIGILLPAMQKARENTRGISCVSQHKQAITGMQMYAQDYDGYIGAYQDGDFIFASLYINGKYVANKKMLNCPVLDASSFGPAYYSMGVYRYDRGGTSAYDARIPEQGDYAIYLGERSNPTGIYYSTKRMRSPSRTYMLADTRRGGGKQKQRILVVFLQRRSGKQRNLPQPQQHGQRELHGWTHRNKIHRCNDRRRIPAHPDRGRCIRPRQLNHPVSSHNIMPEQQKTPQGKIRISLQIGDARTVFQ